MILLILLAQPTSGDDSNVTLDDERLEDNVPKGLQKVELDLDDALFLEFEEPDEKEEPEPTDLPDTPATAAEDEKKAKRPARWFADDAPLWQRWWVYVLIGLICLLLGAAGVYFFLKLKFEDMHQTQTSLNATAATAHSAGTAQSQTGNATAQKKTRSTPHTSYRFEQFQVEYQDQGHVRILRCRISISRIPQDLHDELLAQLLPVRDSIYLYLKKSSIAFLDSPENSDKLRADITTAINRHLTKGRIPETELLFDEYVVQ